MTPEEEKKSIQAMVEAGEIEKYSSKYFQMMGSIGGKKRWKDITEEERKDFGKFLEKTRKLSTD